MTTSCDFTRANNLLNMLLNRPTGWSSFICEIGFADSILTQIKGRAYLAIRGVYFACLSGIPSPGRIRPCSANENTQPPLSDSNLTVQPQGCTSNCSGCFSWVFLLLLIFSFLLLIFSFLLDIRRAFLYIHPIPKRVLINFSAGDRFSFPQLDV